MHRRTLLVVIVLSALSVVLLPAPALACPVCFGQSDSPLASATNWGIFILLAITGGVLTAFVGFFFYLFKRSRAILAEPRPMPRSAHSGGSY